MARIKPHQELLSSFDWLDKIFENINNPCKETKMQTKEQIYREALERIATHPLRNATLHSVQVTKIATDALGPTKADKIRKQIADLQQQLVEQDVLPFNYEDARKMGFGAWAELGEDTSDGARMRDVMASVLGRTVHSRRDLYLGDWHTWIRYCKLEKLKKNG